MRRGGKGERERGFKLGVIPRVGGGGPGGLARSAFPNKLKCFLCVSGKIEKRQILQGITRHNSALIFYKLSNFVRINKSNAN